jgi:putative SOS response-associated peptidase YedK
MCGRVRLSSDYSEIKIRLKFAPNSVAPNFEPDWNKPPTAPMLVAIRSVDGERVPKMMKWGLIPRWAKDDKLLSRHPDEKNYYVENRTRLLRACAKNYYVKTRNARTKNSGNIGESAHHQRRPLSHP